jgi:hypothetical protein
MANSVVLRVDVRVVKVGGESNRPSCWFHELAPLATFRRRELA